eukprot:CAMPEP_0168612278 /NCGR_PEP_ID=MMETSP0449_2-20121227/2827_1 /TAXON_ID=1082188 /ORGANISM="Strombidium rassoulzadegani, Strain ras09" /LENGTH=135 /DNA_ID=CAMNT_0008652823 /DNA_START=356 /DNA_END=763 /DNA_ORIENTATION=-
MRSRRELIAAKGKGPDQSAHSQEAESLPPEKGSRARCHPRSTRRAVHGGEWGRRGWPELEARLGSAPQRSQGPRVATRFSDFEAQLVRSHSLGPGRLLAVLHLQPAYVSGESAYAERGGYPLVRSPPKLIHGSLG